MERYELLLTINKFRKLYALKRKSVMEKYSLTANEIDVLLCLGNNPGFNTARDIVDIRNLPKSQVSKSVEHLIQLGYLTRYQSKKDRRSIHLILQDAALKIINDAQEMQKLYLDNLFKGIEEDKKNQLLEIVYQMKLNVEEEFSNDN